MADPEAKPVEKKRNLSGGIAWDGDRPVFVLYDDGERAIVGHFSRVEGTSASLSESPPESEDEE